MDSGVIQNEENEIQEDEESHTKMSYNIEDCSLLFRLPVEPPTPPPPPPRKDDTNGIMLEPDHPLLAKFQASLKQQLERQIAKLSVEVLELEVGIKKKSEERDTLGVSVYDAQQMVALQYESVEQYEHEIKKLTTERDEMECELNDMTETHTLTRNKLDIAEKKELELRDEVNTMNFMFKQMNDWEEKLQSDLAVHQRISDKSKIDRKQFTEEKRNLDFLIYKLMTEVFRLENGLDHLSMQLRVKEHERENLATSIASANADIEALENEHKRLMHSWNCVLVAIGHRDKLYNNTKKELEKEQEILQNTITEIAAMKKLNNEQMARNEQLTLVKGRIDMDKTALNAKLLYENDKIVNLEKKLMDTQAMLIQSTKDLDELINEKKVKQLALEDMRREIEKSICVKLDIEERILALLQEQISSDKISKYMNTTIRGLRESNRDTEIQLAEIENKNADICVRIERQKVLNGEVVQLLEEIMNNERLHEKALNEIKSELRQAITDGKKSFNKLDVANKKYEELLQKCGGVELTPDEIKIRDLERSIQEFDEKNAKLKAFWLRQQSYVISLRDERHKQMNEMNLIRKQSMLLQQKNLKLEDHLEILDKQEKKFERKISNMKCKVDKISKDLFLKKGYREVLDINTASFKTEFVQKLQDAELECLRLEDKLAELEDEKNKLSEDLIESNRETLAWEKKVKLAEETKHTIKLEQSAEGELGSMKAEIHRMTVRYSQLRKAQEKLIHDLNHCVSRREFIFINAEATEKRMSQSGAGKVNNRINMKRKLEDVKSKVKKTQLERISLEKKIRQAQDLEKELYEKISNNERIIEDMGTQMIEFINNIETAKFDRQKELEMLVFKQHKLRSLTSISKGQYRPQFRSEAALDIEMSQQQEVNSKLQTVVENLIIDFPKYYPSFIKILNTLRVVHIN